MTINTQRNCIIERENREINGINLIRINNCFKIKKNIVGVIANINVKFWGFSTGKVNKFLSFNNEVFINFYIKIYSNDTREFIKSIRNI